jgi:hypothetical protein
MLFKVFRYFSSFFKTVKKPEDFLTNKPRHYEYDAVNQKLHRLIFLQNISFTFFISGLKSLEDISLVNFFLFINDFFNFYKKPLIKKIFLSNRSSYKMCVIYTYRPDITLKVFEKIVLRLKEIPFLDYKSLFTVTYFVETETLVFYIKNLSFFGSNFNNLTLPTVSCTLSIKAKYLDTDLASEIIRAFDLNPGMEIKIVGEKKPAPYMLCFPTIDGQIGPYPV